MPARRRPPPPPDPLESAQAAGLRYVSDATPGIRRRRAGRGFAYVSADGRPLRDNAALARIRSLAIPPAYTDVWICPTPNGHLQATGRDARGRKQYRYHPEWREVRDETKFGRMLAFSDALPRLRAADRGRPRQARVCHGRRCWPPWSGCSSAPASGSGTTSTPGPTARSGSPRCATTTSRSRDPRCASSSGARAARRTAWRSATGGSPASWPRCQALPGADCSSTWTTRASGWRSARAT